MDVLHELKARGIGLGLYTQGPLRLQQRKIGCSGLSRHFDAIAVVSRENSCQRYNLWDVLGCSPGNCVVVGNSVSTDVKVALDAGSPAIHYENPNAWKALNQPIVARNSYSTVQSLAEVPSVVARLLQLRSSDGV